MNIQLPVYKSRWGFHPCGYELFAKLRLLHKWYWQTVYDFHRWHRWCRKEPHQELRRKLACKRIHFSPEDSLECAVTCPMPGKD